MSNLTRQICFLVCLCLSNAGNKQILNEMGKSHLRGIIIENRASKVQSQTIRTFDDSASPTHAPTVSPTSPAEYEFFVQQVINGITIDQYNANITANKLALRTVIADGLTHIDTADITLNSVETHESRRLTTDFSKVEFTSKILSFWSTITTTSPQNSESKPNKLQKSALQSTQSTQNSVENKENDVKMTSFHVNVLSANSIIISYIVTYNVYAFGTTSPSAAYNSIKTELNNYVTGATSPSFTTSLQSYGTTHGNSAWTGASSTSCSLSDFSTANGVQDDSSDDKKLNVPLIVGLAVGLGGAFILVVIFLIFYLRTKAKKIHIRRASTVKSIKISAKYAIEPEQTSTSVTKLQEINSRSNKQAAV